MKLFPLLLIFIFSISLSASVASNANDVKPILVGSSVPSAELVNVDNTKVNIKELTKGQGSIVVFYRGGWCPYCNRHLQALGQSKDELKKLGFQIIAISPDKATELKKSIKDQTLEYTLLSDSKLNAAKAFGIAFQVEEKLVKKYKTKFKIDLEASSGEKHHQLPVPSVFIFNKEGMLTFQYVNPNYKTRLSKDVLLAAAKSAQ